MKRRVLRRRGRRSALETLEFRRLLAVLPPLGDLTEGNAASWEAFADGATASVSNDSSRIRVGSQSLKLDTQGGFDTGVRLPAPAARWDLNGYSQLDFWVYGENPHALEWQGNQPIIKLVSPAGSMQLAPNQQLMPNHAWAQLSVPLTGSDVWQTSVQGTFDLANVTALEIHQDTWDFGFQAWYDGVQFAQPLDSPTLAEPRGVAVDSNNRTIVAEAAANRVRIHNASGVGVALFGSPGSGNGEFDTPSDVAVNNANEIFVVDSGNNRVQVFRPNGTFLRAFGSSGVSAGQFNAPTGIAYDLTTNRIYVADSGNHRVQRFFANGAVDTSWGNGGIVGTTGSVLRDHSGFDGASDVAVNPIDGNVYVADFGNHRLEVFNANGDYVRTHLGVYRARALAFDGAGNLYIAGADPNDGYPAFSGRLRVLKAGDDLVSEHYAGGLDDLGRLARGVALRADGHILVADTLNSRLVQVVPSLETPIHSLAIETHGTSATISWTSLQPGPSKVQLGGTLIVDPTITSTHAVTVTGLTPNTRLLYSFAFLDTFNGIERWTTGEPINTGAPLGQTEFLRIKSAGLVYTDADADAGYTRLPQAQIDAIRDRYFRVADFYWRNSGFKVWLDFTILEIDRDLSLGADLLALQQIDVEAAGFTAADNLDGIYSASPLAFANLGGGGIVFNRLIASAMWGAQDDFVAVHEVNHSLDGSAYGFSGLGKYEFNHGIWAVPNGLGRDFAINGQILRNMLPANLTATTAPFTKIVNAPDADDDGVPDVSPAGLSRPLPITESTLGSSTANKDSDGDGLSDLDEGKLLTNASSNLNDVDSDDDGLRDGVDPNPLYKVSNIVRQATPTVDGAIGAGENWTVLTDGWGFTNTSLVNDNNLHQAAITTYAAWDDTYFYLALQGPPGNSRIHLDGSADNWFFGPDNYLLNVRNDFNSQSVAVNVGLPDIFRQIDNDGQFSEFFDNNPQFSLPYQGRTIFNNPGDGLGFGGRLVTEADLFYQRGGVGNDSVWEMRIPWSDTTQLRGFNGKEMALSFNHEGDRLFETDHAARIRLVAASSEPPVLALSGDTSYTENAAPRLLAPLGLADDFDSFDLAGGALTVAIIAGGGGADRLQVRHIGNSAGQIGVSGSQVSYGGRVIGNVTGGTAASPLVVALNVNATPEAAQALLRSITYRALSDAPKAGLRTIRFTLSDGDGNTSQPRTLALNVIAVNDNPVIASFGGNIVVYRENAAPARITTTAMVTDKDHANFGGGSLRVAIATGAVASDRLAIATVGGITRTATTVSLGGSVFASYTSGGGPTPLVFTFNAQATPAKIQALLRAITYLSSSDNPVAGLRTVSAQLTDPLGATSANATKQIRVIPVNDPPRITGSGSPIGYTLNSPAVLIGSAFGVSDADSVNFAGGKLAVQVTSGKHFTNRIEFGGAFTLVGNQVRFNNTTIGIVEANGVGVSALRIAFNANATAGIVQGLVRSIRFRTLGSSNTAGRVITFIVSDGDGGTSNTATRTVNVAS